MRLRSWWTAAAVCGVAVVGAYVRIIRPWGLRWGATDDEVSREMPGDDWVPRPAYATTKAIGVAARPEDIWPWLAQMGYRRGGLYSIDWLDRLFGILDAPSATKILPEYRTLAAGDVIPIGKGGDFPVLSAEPNRSLVLAGEANGTRWSWAFGLYPLEDGTTRLVSRNRAAGESFAQREIVPWAVDLPAFIMTRTMLVGLKRRAEGLAKERAAARTVSVVH